MKYSCTAVASLLMLSLFGQSPKMNYPVGNSRNLQSVYMAGDHAFVITRKEKLASVWNRNSGHLAFTFLLDNSANPISPDGKTAIHFENSAVTAITLKNGERQIILPPGKAKGDAVLFSHNGKSILTNNAASDSVTIWSFPKGEFKQTFKADIHQLFFSKDNRYVTTIQNNSFIKWDLALQKQVYVFTLDKSFEFLAVSPDANLAAAAIGFEISVWNPATGAKTGQLKGHKNMIAGISLSADGKRLLSYGKDSTVIAWETATGKALGTVTGTPSQLSGRTCRISADGKKAAVCYREYVTLYELPSCKRYDSINTAQYYYNEDNNTLGFTADSKYMIFGTRNQLNIYAVQLKKNTPLETVADRIRNTLVSPGNKYLVTNNEDQASLVDINTGICLAKMQMGRNDFRCAFSDNNKWLLMWDGRDTRVFSIPDGKLTGTILNTKYGYVIKPFISPDGKRTGILARNGISIWETATGKALCRTDVPGKLVFESPVFTNDGQFFLTANQDSVLLFRSDNGAFVKKFDRENKDSAYSFVMMSPDDLYMMTQNDKNNQATVWEMSTGKKLYSLQVNNAQFSQQGNHVIAGEQLFAIATGKEEEKTRVPAENLVVMRPAADRFTVTLADDDRRQKKLVQVKENKTGYTYFLMPLEGTDYLVFDAYDHFDGTSAARKFLSLTCGNKLFPSSKKLDQLWVPGLVERILKGENPGNAGITALTGCPAK